MNPSVIKQDDKIAIIGMAGQFPGALNLELFWDNLVAGIESIRFFSPSELQESALDNDLKKSPDFIPAKGYLDKAEYFAADFFKFSPNKAKLLDPQFRLLLEAVWAAWENAGYNVKEYQGIVGVYATSSSYDSYWQKNLLQNSDYRDSSYDYDIFISNAKDFLATQIAYQFNFKGPAVNIQTACSSSLVAINQACDDLLNNKCHIAVVGAACITFPLKSGYLFKEGMIHSKDGHCRAFAKDASGVVPGNGGGVVLLKKLSQAKLDGDHIFATICGYAVNNDGHDKLSYAAPSIKGQFDVLAAAAKMADIDPSTISYIEAHGTGTLLGDQIEVKALKKYRFSQKQPQNCCYLGSVKTNIGHLDVAAGMAGFIKTALALYHKKIPKTLYAQITNPDLKLEDNAFQIVNETIDWPSYESFPRRAGVSSFGIGGTNAHIILEEVCNHKTESFHKKEAFDEWQILPLSAQTKDALIKKKDELAIFIEKNKNHFLFDIAYTLQNGRVNFKEKLAIACSTKEEAFNALYLPGSFGLLQLNQLDSTAKCIFLFPENIELAFPLLSQLYLNIPFLRESISRCIDIVEETLQLALTKFFKDPIDETFLKVCSLEKDLLTFIIEYSLAKYWLFLGVKPVKLLGYGLGEYTAACFSGIFSVMEAVKLIALRFDIRQLCINKVVLSLLSTPEKANQILEGFSFDMISNNAPQNCCIAVDRKEINKVELQLIKNNLIYKNLNNFHPTNISKKSHNQLEQLVKSIKFNQPHIAIISSKIAQETSMVNMAEPVYWINNFITCIAYSSAITLLLSQKNNIFIELGFSDQLCRWTQQINNADLKRKIIVVPGITGNNHSEFKKEMAINLAKMWSSGLVINWQKWNVGNSKQLNKHQKIPLPTYPFSRQPYLIEAQLLSLETKNFPFLTKEKNYEFYAPNWKQLHNTVSSTYHITALIYIEDKTNIGSKIVKNIARKNPDLRAVPLSEFVDTTIKTDEWINNRANNWQEKLNILSDKTVIDVLIFQPNKYEAFYDLVALSRALSRTARDVSIKLHLIMEGMVKIDPTDSINPLSTLSLGPAFCLPLENSAIKVRCIDVHLQEVSQQPDFVIEELMKQENNLVVALRGDRRYIRDVMRLKNEEQIITNKLSPIQFKKNGVYVITGGLGGIGLALAKYLAKTFNANIVLISKGGLPERNKWLDLLNNQGTSIKLANKLQCLIQIEKEANQVLTFAANIDNEASISEIVLIIKRRFGTINGVIHAASSMPEDMLKDKKVDQIEAMFNAKIEGVNVLHKIFSNEPLDFMLLFSSINAFKGSIGIADYVSANAYLNAFAMQHKHNFYPLIAIAWDTWKDVGMRYNYLSSKKQNEFFAYAIGYGKWRPFLIEHKIDDKMVLVGALSVELSIMGFYKKWGRQSVVVMQEVSFLAPAIVDNLEDFQLLSRINSNNEIEIKTNTKSSERIIFRALLTQKNKLSSPFFDPQAILKQFENLQTLPQNDSKQTKKNRINIGCHWNCLIWVKQKESKYLAKISLPENLTQEVDDFTLHPSMLDLGYSFNVQYMDKLHLPFYIDELIVFTSLPATFYSFIETHSINHDAGTCISDVILFDENGTLLVMIKGFVLKSLEVNNIEVTLQQSNDTQEGLSSCEGIAALKQIMQEPYSEIIISKNKELEKSIGISQVENIFVSNVVNDKVDAIKSTGSFSDKIISIWIRLLGVESVSLQDNFFDLNGDSLLAIEVCYHIKIETSIHAAPNILLEHPVLKDFIAAVSALTKHS